MARPVLKLVEKPKTEGIAPTSLADLLEEMGLLEDVLSGHAQVIIDGYVVRGNDIGLLRKIKVDERSSLAIIRAVRGG